MTKRELELAYRLALNEYIDALNATQAAITEQQDPIGYSDHKSREEDALEKYRKAIRAFMDAPRD